MLLPIRTLSKAARGNSLIASILLITLIIYLPTLWHGFVIWDDPIYITENPLVNGEESPEKVFTKTFEGHYHPFTLLSLRIDYQIGQGHPWIFHLHNVLLHLLNIWLVWLIVFQLSRQHSIALYISLLFAIHPLQVEVVAWATARKDLLYAAFMLLSLKIWLSYITQAHKHRYLLSFCCFLLACLSKAQAIMLVAFLPFLDHYLGRPIPWKKSLLEKLPFMFVGLLVGILAIMAQDATGYTSEQSFQTSWSSLISYASWAALWYNLKLAVPVSLSAYYPYPIPGVDIHPGLFYLSIPLMISLTFLGIMLWRKKRMSGLGMMFFLVCLLPMLKILPVSNFLTADRYAYVASIGWFLIPVGLLYHFTSRWKHLLLLSLSVFYISQTVQRIPVWEDSERLLTDILEKHPRVVPALIARGKIGEEKGDHQAALQDYNQAIQIQPWDARSLRSRGLLHAKNGNWQEAMRDFNDAIELDSTNADAYVNRARVHIFQGEYTEASRDITRALTLSPKLAEALNTRGIIHRELGQRGQALRDFSDAIRLRPEQAGYYFNRGSVLADSGLYEAALADLYQAEKFGWNGPQIRLLEAKCLLRQGKFNEARNLIEWILKANSEWGEAWTLLGKILYHQQQYQDAEKALNHALGLDAGQAEALYLRALTRLRLGNGSTPCADLQAAVLLHHSKAPDTLRKYCQEKE